MSNSKIDDEHSRWIMSVFIGTRRSWSSANLQLQHGAHTARTIGPKGDTHPARLGGLRNQTHRLIRQNENSRNTKYIHNTTIFKINNRTKKVKTLYHHQSMRNFWQFFIFFSHRLQQLSIDISRWNQPHSKKKTKTKTSFIIHVHKYQLAIFENEKAN